MHYKVINTFEFINLDSSKKRVVTFYVFKEFTYPYLIEL